MKALKKAVVCSPWPMLEHQLQAYPKTAALSTPKEQIGQFLFSLVTDAADRQGWTLFERYLGGCYKGAGQ